MRCRAGATGLRGGSTLNGPIHGKNTARAGRDAKESSGKVDYPVSAAILLRIRMDTGRRIVKQPKSGCLAAEIQEPHDAGDPATA